MFIIVALDTLQIPMPDLRRSMPDEERSVRQSSFCRLPACIRCFCASAAFAGILFLLSSVLSGAAAQQAAHFTVTQEVVSPGPHHLSATIGSYGAGARFFPGGDFEPIIYRDWFLATADAPSHDPGRIIASRAALTRYNSLRSGALDGAQMSVMRLENGKFRVVRQGVIPRGGFQVGTWHLAHRAGQVVPAGQRKFTFQIASWQRLEVPLWLSVRAIDWSGRLSEISDPIKVQLPAALPKERDPVNTPSMESREYEAYTPARSFLVEKPQKVRAHVNEQGTLTVEWEAPERAWPLAGYVVYFAHEDPETFESLQIETEGAGEPVRAGDLVVLRHAFYKPERSDILSDRLWNATEGSRLLLPRPLGFWPGEDSGRDWSLEPHAKNQDWGGRTYLQLDLAEGKAAALSVYNHAGTDQDWYPVLRPDVPYRVSMWLRANRPGQGVFRFSGRFAKDIPPITLEYGPEWRHVTAEFTVPRLLREMNPVGQMRVEFEGPAQIHVDDLRVHRADTAYLDYTEEEYARLAEANLSSLRTHGLIKTKRRTYDLADLVSDDGVKGRVPGLPNTLSMMQRAGVVPWLQIEPHFTREEWLGLIEYLAAPFDPETDDPQALPWAALRVQQGRSHPWVQDFDSLYFELGNETWNRLFAPWTFPRMRDAGTGQVLSPGRTYGHYQTYVADILRSSPWWKVAGLEDKVQFVIGGWNGFDYGSEAARAAPTASDLLSIANYNGGWDQDEGPPDRTPQSYFNVLNQVSQSTIPVAEGLSQDAADIAEEQDRQLMFGTYEAGPGYALNGLNGARVTPEQARAQEEVMKSQAGGVATLDSFLAERRAGFTHQNFFTFGEGTYWKSHAHWHEGGTPYLPWHLLSLMTRFGQGDMLDVHTQSVPVEALEPMRRRIHVDAAPQIAVYAIKSERRLTVFAISRRVPGYPDPEDTGCTPLRITLPIRTAIRITLHKTLGLFADHGADGTLLRIATVPLPTDRIAQGWLDVGRTKDGSRCGLPAASAYIYSFDDPVYLN